ncbi:hypothetical protein CUJ91_04730 [Paraburkholderia graminis]|uniref:hypothetical protein n=1 Tax=Paraburkholderia graminis TaxID=60548 RepID=UPI000DEF6584|nr:hypothetical protein [Paraburkholderia graminis]AXF07302.1 hypothetical protein CUJ91_04730 [Paraburkholderia graminis]
MDENYERLKARVDALELAVLAISETHRDLLPNLGMVFHREYNEAVRQESVPHVVDLTRIQSQPRPPRNRLAEKIRVEVFRRFARLFEADV